MAKAYPILFVSFFIVAAAWIGLLNWLIKHLQHHHPEQYQALGAPGLFSNNNLRSNIKFLKFLYQRQFKKLSDAKLDFICYLLMTAIIVLLIGYGIIIALLPDYIYVKTVQLFYR